MRGLQTLALIVCMLFAGTARAAPDKITLSPTKERGFTVTYTESNAPPGTYVVGKTWPAALIGFEFGAEFIGTLYACDGVSFVASKCDAIVGLTVDVAAFTYLTVRSHYLVVVATDESASTSSRLSIRGTHEQVSQRTLPSETLRGARARCADVMQFKERCFEANFVAAKTVAELVACIETPNSALARRVCFQDFDVYWGDSPTNLWTLDDTFAHDLDIVFRKGSMIVAEWIEARDGVIASAAVIRINSGVAFRRTRVALHSPNTWFAVNGSFDDPGAMPYVVEHINFARLTTTPDKRHRFEVYNAKINNHARASSSMGIGMNPPSCTDLVVDGADIYASIGVDAKADCNGRSDLYPIIRNSTIRCMSEGITSTGTPRAFKVSDDSQLIFENNTIIECQIQVQSDTGSVHYANNNTYIGFSKGAGANEGVPLYSFTSGGDAVGQIWIERNATYINTFGWDPTTSNSDSDSWMTINDVDISVDIQGVSPACNYMEGGSEWITTSTAYDPGAGGFFNIDIALPEDCYNKNQTPAVLHPNTITALLAASTAGQDSVIRIGEDIERFTGGTQFTTTARLTTSSSALIPLVKVVTSEGPGADLVDTGHEACAQPPDVRLCLDTVAVDSPTTGTCTTAYADGVLFNAFCTPVRTVRSLGR